MPQQFYLLSSLHFLLVHRVTLVGFFSSSTVMVEVLWVSIGDHSVLLLLRVPPPLLAAPPKRAGREGGGARGSGWTS